MIMNIVFGLIPEFLYYFLFISKIKQLDKKNIIWFFILTFINCFLAVLRINHNFIMYVMFDIAEYLILKVLYRDKTCITDFFLLLSIEIYLLVISGLCYFLIPNYMIAYVINRIIIFAPLIFINKIRYFYKKYRQMWNRNDSKKNPIKSITLRNTSIVIMDILIVAVYLILMYSFN